VWQGWQSWAAHHRQVYLPGAATVLRRCEQAPPVW
jgi:hypothetical protein